ncbi:MAG: TonB-dependent receptor [Halothiobacillaceae bacterium]|nr:TonB-dependent receptor [Halothiobacillaceae bacterium]
MKRAALLLLPLFSPLALAEFQFQPSVFLDGAWYGDSVHGEGNNMILNSPGLQNTHAHGGDEHDHAGGGHNHGTDVREGLNLRYAETTLYGLLPGVFDTRTNITFSPRAGEVSVEEFWFRSLGLPAGLQVKAGKFLSDIGYLNNQHPHQWDMADAPLAYQLLLGGALNQTGVQLNWTPPLPWYTRLGMEISQGENSGYASVMGPATLHHEHEEEEQGEEEPAVQVPFDSRYNGARMVTAFVKIAPEIGDDHALQLGAFWSRSRQHQELHEPHPGVNAALHGMQGSAWIAGADVVYKYDAPQAYGVGDLKIQAEYIYQNKDLRLTYHELQPGLVGQPRELRQDGFYVQAQYGILPRFTLGARYDMTGLTHEALRAGSTRGPTTPSYFEDMKRVTAALTWHITETQKLRFQVARTNAPVGVDDGAAGRVERQSFNQYYIQYQIGFGAHAAHGF